MKKFKPVSMKTIVLGRTGKTVIHTPLAVSSNTAGSQPNQGSSSLLEAVDDLDIPVISPDEVQRSEFHQRNYSSVANWEKIRDKLLTTAVREETLPEKYVCAVCKQREATVRCRYCGPRQFFCSTCAHDLHAEGINSTNNGRITDSFHCSLIMVQLNPAILVLQESSNGSN